MTPQTLTPAELDELAALEAKATPGEWAATAHGAPQERWWTVNKSVGMPRQVARIMSSFEHDARLIAALRNHAPALLSMARRLATCVATFDEDHAALVAQLTAATARAEAAEAKLANVEAWALAETKAADARAQAAEKRCGEVEAALRRIAEGDAGHQGSFDWPEFYESIRKHAREALAAAKLGGG